MNTYLLSGYIALFTDDPCIPNPGLSRMRGLPSLPLAFPLPCRKRDFLNQAFYGPKREKFTYRGKQGKYQKNVKTKSCLHRFYLISRCDWSTQL